MSSFLSWKYLWSSSWCVKLMSGWWLCINILLCWVSMFYAYVKTQLQLYDSRTALSWGCPSAEKSWGLWGLGLKFSPASRSCLSCDYSTKTTFPGRNAVTWDFFCIVDLDSYICDLLVNFILWPTSTWDCGLVEVVEYCLSVVDRIVGIKNLGTLTCCWST